MLADCLAKTMNDAQVTKVPHENYWDSRQPEEAKLIKAGEQLQRCRTSRTEGDSGSDDAKTMTHGSGGEEYEDQIMFHG